MKDKAAVTKPKRSLRNSKEIKSEPEKPFLIVNVANTHYNVVKEVFKKSFSAKLLYSDTSPDWDLLWIDSGINSSIISKLNPYQKVNHFEEMCSLSRKNYLAQNMMRIRKLMPGEYDFVPQTWILPAENVEFKAQFDGVSAFILKPEALCQGKGIFLTNTYEDINPEERYIAQKYISNPYLIEGLKFDLRI